jgi:hypothetical protein
MIPRLAACALLFTSATAVAETASFADQPIACGSNLAWTQCRASFDGWTLTIAYKAPDGRVSEAIYRSCTALPDMIRCGGGEWRNGALRGQLPARVVGLWKGKPFPE